MVLSALRWFPTGLVVPVLVLMIGARGLSVAQTGQVIALYSVTTLSLELPTGGLADSWGRKPVVVASALLQAAGLALLALFGGVPFILLGAVLLGISRALSSGPVESWYVDAMHAAGSSEVEPGLARGQVAESLALGGGSIIGGLLPRLGPGLPESGTGLLQLSVPFLVAAAGAVLHAVAAVGLLTSERGSRGSVGRTVTQAVGIAVRQAPVRRMLVVAAGLGIALSGVELLAPNRFADLVGSSTSAAAIFGFLSAAAFVAAAVGAAISARLPGPRGLVGAGAFAAMGLCALAVALPAVAAAGAGYLALYIAVGLQGPVLAGLLHARITSAVRSTMLSVQSLVFQAGGALASLVVGALATRAGLLAGFGVVCAVCLASAGILVRDTRRM